MKFNKKESIIFNKLFYYLCIPLPFIIILHLMINKEPFPDRWGLPELSVIALLFGVFAGFLMKCMAKLQKSLTIKKIKQRLLVFYKTPFALLCLGYIWAMYLTIISFIENREMTSVLFIIPGILTGYKIIIEEILDDEIFT